MIARVLLFGCWLLLGIALTACNGAKPPIVTCAEPVPEAESPKFSAADLQADLTALYTGLREAHADLYARRPKTELDSAFEKALAGLDQPLTQAEAERYFQRFVAAGRVAHARIDLPFARWSAYRDAGGRALPLFLRVDADRVYVWDLALPIAGLATGDEVLAVDGQPALPWLNDLGALVSADTDYMRYAQIERLLPMLVWLTHGDVKQVTLLVRHADGQESSVTVMSRCRAEIQAATATTVATPEPASREFRWLDGTIGYLKPGPFYDDRPEAETPWGTTAFRTFIDTSFQELIDKQGGTLIIDLRDNPGGDNSFSDLMLAWIATRPFRFSPGFEIKVSPATIASNQARLDSAPADAGGASADMAKLFVGKQTGDVVMYPIPEVAPRPGDRFKGKVYVLINRHTYSNATNVAAVIQDYEFGTLLGEETSDLASTLGAMEQFTLPRTGIVVGYPKARILRPNGDPSPRGVVPDHALASPHGRGEEDAVLAMALEWIQLQAP